MQTYKKELNNKLKEMVRMPLYDKKENQKKIVLKNILKDVLIFHYINCPEYKKICKYFNFNPKNLKNLNEIPYITSTLFKEKI